MSTWMDDLKRNDPELASAYAVTGSQSIDSLQKMVKALSMLPMLNTVEDDRRLKAAQYILNHQPKRKH